MIKKLLAINLIFSILASSSATIYAWAPTDFDNPKCIDIRKLGKSTDYISIQEKVCKCKKCSIDAFTYGALKQYVEDQKKHIENLDTMIKLNNQTAIDYQTKMHGAFNIVLLPPALYGLLTKIPVPEVPIAIALITSASGTFFGLYFWYKKHESEALVFENKMQQENIYSTLKHISTAIEEQRYIGRNFVLVSKNNDPNKQDAFAQFAYKDGISYNESKFNDEYFYDINENMIKPLLIKIENGVFRTYEVEEYNTKLRDFMKKAYYITVPAAVLMGSYNLCKFAGPEIIEFIKTSKATAAILDFAKKHKLNLQSVKDIFILVLQFTENSDSEFLKVIYSGAKTFTLATDIIEKTDKSTQTNTNKNIKMKSAFDTSSNTQQQITREL